MDSSAQKKQEWKLVCLFRQAQNARQVVAVAREVGGGLLTEAAQRLLLQLCFEDAIAKAYPPTRAFCGRVAKAAVLAAEQDQQEILDELVDVHTTYLLASQETIGLPIGWGHKSYAYSGQPTDNAPAAATSHLSEVEDAQRGNVTLAVSENLFEGSTGCHEWEAGFGLAEFLLSNPSLCRGKACLELGCGAGLVGTILWRLGAAPLLLTDGDAETVRNCRENLMRNDVPVRPAEQLNSGSGRVSERLGVEGQQNSGGAEREGSGNMALSCRDYAEVDVRVLLWEDARALEICPDLIVGSDLLYDPAAIPPLVSLLHSLLKPRSSAKPHRSCDDDAGDDSAAAQRTNLADSAVGSEACEREAPVAYIATMLRNEATLALFVKTASAAGLRLEDMSVETRAPSVCFQHLETLESCRDRLVLHRISWG